MINKKKKQQILQDLVEKLKRQKVVIFTDYTGLKVKQLEELRKTLREKQAEYQVIKKTLIDLGLKKSGLDKISVKELTGQIGLIFGYQDEVEPAKIAYQFGSENESFRILKGLLEGEVIEAEELEKLSKLPSREVLLARLVGQLNAPISNLVYQLRGNLVCFLNELRQIK